MSRWIDDFCCWLFELLAIAVEFEPSDLNETGPPVLMMWDDAPVQWPWEHDIGGEQ